jgi:hypothetical protein
LRTWELIYTQEKGGRWILGLSKPMSQVRGLMYEVEVHNVNWQQDELKEIEKRIYNHY